MLNKFYAYNNCRTPPLNHEERTLILEAVHRADVEIFKDTWESRHDEGYGWPCLVIQSMSRKPTVCGCTISYTPKIEVSVEKFLSIFGESTKKYTIYGNGINN